MLSVLVATHLLSFKGCPHPKKRQSLFWHPVSCGFSTNYQHKREYPCQKHVLELEFRIQPKMTSPSAIIYKNYLFFGKEGTGRYKWGPFHPFPQLLQWLGHWGRCTYSSRFQGSAMETRTRLRCLAADEAASQPPSLPKPLMLLGPPAHLPVTTSFSHLEVLCLELLNSVSSTCRWLRNLGINSAWDHTSVLSGQVLLQSGAKVKTNGVCGGEVEDPS